VGKIVGGKNLIGAAAAFLVIAAGSLVPTAVVPAPAVPAAAGAATAQNGGSATGEPALAQNGLSADSSTANAAPLPAPKPAGPETSSSQPSNPRHISPETLRTAQAIFKDIKAERWKATHRKASASGDRLLVSLVQWLDLRREGKHGFEEIAAFIASHPGWPLLRTLTTLAEEAMTDATSDTLVLSWFAAHPPLTTKGLIRYGEALLRQGRETEGTAIIRRAWITGNFGYRQERTFIARHHKRWTREDNWARLDRLLWEGRLKVARRTMRRVDKDRQALAEARLRLRLNRGGVDWAIRHVPPYLLGDPGFQYERLRWRRRRDRDDAREILSSPPLDLVRPELWWKERAAVTRQALVKGDISVAYQLASSHKQVQGASFAEAEWLSGWIALRFLHNGEAALNHFTRLYGNVRYPISRSRAAYWAARAAQSLGRNELAQGWYAKAAEFLTTFHGQLAATQTGGETTPSLPPDPLPTAEEKARFNTRDLVRLVRLLGEIGEYKQIKPFAIHLNDLVSTPGQRALVADLAHDNGRPDVGVKIAHEATRSGVNLVSRGYPIPAQFDKEHPETPLLLALMRQESSFDSFAQSHAGARGLMQIMPATARNVARRLNVPYSKTRLMTDPGYNMMLGRAYISGLLNQYGDSYVLALAAYNAGPNRVKRWLRNNGDPRTPQVDALDWIESIPFYETRTYIQRVLGNLQVYRMRLNSPQMAWSLKNDLHYQN